MKSAEEILEKVTGILPTSVVDVGLALKAMHRYADQFRGIWTTDGHEVLFDDIDFPFLRHNTLFMDKQRNIVMTTNMTPISHYATPVAKLLLGLEGKAIIHYKDRNPLNLKRNNLEVISREKTQYKKGMSKNNTSGYKGVSWNKHAKKYSANIKVQGKAKFLGYYSSVHDAGLAYNRGALFYFGPEYALINDIPRQHIRKRDHSAEWNKLKKLEANRITLQTRLEAIREKTGSAFLVHGTTMINHALNKNEKEWLKTLKSIG